MEYILAQVEQYVSYKGLLKPESCNVKTASIKCWLLTVSFSGFFQYLVDSIDYLFGFIGLADELFGACL